MLPFILLTVIGVVVLLICEYRQIRWGIWVSKPAASLGFIATAIAAGAHLHRCGQVLLVALILSWFGDLFLIFSGRREFLAGLTAFLLAHIAFCVAFLCRGITPVGVLVAAVPVALAVVPVGRWLLPQVPAGLRVPVVAYIVVIGAMVVLSGGVAASGRPIVVVAAMAFFLSDLSVARDRFVSSAFVNRLWGLPLYYAAQLLFAIWSGT